PGGASRSGRRGGAPGSSGAPRAERGGRHAPRRSPRGDPSRARPRRGAHRRGQRRGGRPGRPAAALRYVRHPGPARAGGGRRGRRGRGRTVGRTGAGGGGGRGEVGANAGGGTAATLWLPAATGPVAPSAPREPEVRAPAETAAPAEIAPLPESAPAPRRERASILVIEDEEPVRAMLVEALTRAGHDVQSTADGTAALAQVESGHFDAVLADLALPRPSGRVIARSVNGVSPRPAVVLITGGGHLPDPARLRDHGVALMLVKPFRAERVASIVGDALRLHAPA